MRRKLGIERQQISDRGRGFGAPAEVAASRGDHEIGPEQTGDVHPVRALEGLLVLLLVEVLPEGSEVHPPRVVGVQLHRTPHDPGTSLELARVHDLQSQDPDGVGVQGIQGHGALGRGTKRREVLAEEMRLRQRDERKLVAPIELDRAAGRGQGAIESGRVGPEAKRVFVDEDLREARPEVRLAAVPLNRALQPALELRVGRGSDLFAVSEILELPFQGREMDVVLLPHRRPHGMHEDPVAIGDRCDNAGRDIVLNRKNA